MPEPAGLEGKNYRVRRLLVKLDLDVYDADGFLLERGITDEITIPEVAFHPALVEVLTAMTQLGRGFASRPALSTPTIPATTT